MNPPTDFRYISEDRRRAMLDRRAGERRSVHFPVVPHRLKLVARSEQERTADELRQSGMIVR